MATVYCTNCGNRIEDSDPICAACEEPNKALKSTLSPLAIPPASKIKAPRRNGSTGTTIGVALLVLCGLGAFAYQHFNKVKGQPPTDVSLEQTNESDASEFAIEHLPPPPSGIQLPGQHADPLNKLDFTRLSIGETDLSSRSFVDHATSIDVWSRFDFFQLVLLPEIEAKAQTFAMLGDPQGADLWLHQQTSYVMDAARTIQAHPDWSASDVIQETTNSFALGRVVDHGMVEYLHEHKLGFDQLRTREAKLAQVYQRCLEEVADTPPSRRPPAPEAACKRAILYRGQDEQTASSDGGSSVNSDNERATRNVKVRASPRLEYPVASLKMGEQGDVSVELCATVDGQIRSAELTKSSGYPRLDQAALRWIQESRVEIPADAKSDADRCGLVVRVSFALPKE